MLSKVAWHAACHPTIPEKRSSLPRAVLQASFIGALFVLLTVPVTFYEVAMHLEYFSRPSLQIHVIRILWMVPIYAIDAWAALRFPVWT